MDSSAISVLQMAGGLLLELINIDVSPTVIVFSCLMFSILINHIENTKMCNFPGEEANSWPEWRSEEVRRFWVLSCLGVSDLNFKVNSASLHFTFYRMICLIHSRFQSKCWEKEKRIEFLVPLSKRLVLSVSMNCTSKPSTFVNIEFVHSVPNIISSQNIRMAKRWMIR